MGVFSRDAETVNRDQSSFIDFIFVCGEASSKGNNLPINLFLSSW